MDRDRSIDRRVRLAPAAILAALAAAVPAGAVTPSSGCNESPPPDGNATLGTTVGGETRTYARYAPADYEQQTPYPLLLAFHGTGDEATLQQVAGLGIETWGELFCSQYYGNWQATVDSAGTASDGIVVCPDALHDGSFYRWNDSTDDEFFDALLMEVVADYCVDLERVFVTGHSSGGYFANEIGCEAGSMIRAIAPIAAGGPDTDTGSDTAPGDCQRGKDGKVAALVMHGSDDGVVAPSMGEASRDFWGLDAGCDLASPVAIPAAQSSCARDGDDTHETYAGCDASPYRVEWCLWDGVGHQDMFDVECFPGSFPPQPPGCDTDENLGPPAVWDFFVNLAPEGVPIFADGFEGGTGNWNAAMGALSTSSGGSPPEGSEKLVIDFADISAICSDDDVEPIDTGGQPYLLGDASACVTVTLTDTEVAADATFTAGLSVVLGDGASVASGVQVELALDPSRVPFSWVGDDLAAPLAEYHASFALNLDGASLADGVELDLFDGYDASGGLLFQVVLTRSGGEDRLFLVGHENDGGTQTSMDSSPIAAGWRTVEIAFQTGDGDGVLSLSIDGVGQPSLAALDNDGFQLGSVELGYVAGERLGTSGAYWLDAFESWTSP